MANEDDYVSQILGNIAGDDEVGLDEQTEDYIHGQVAGLVDIGALTEVGAQRAKKAIRRGILAGRGGQMPQPQQSTNFARSGRDTERRAPLGFTEDGSGKNFFSLAASIGSTTTMRAKVSRVSHVDRLLIVPSGPGVVIESIKVGDEEQVLAPGVPAELYGASALTDSNSDNFSPIGPGLDLSVTLRNTTAAAVTGTIGTKCACKR